MSDDDSDRQISGGTVSSIIRYIRSVAGEAAVHQMVIVAGEGRSVEVLDTPENWSTLPQAIALFRAAATVTGDPEVARRIGSESLRLNGGSAMVALLRSLGSPGEVIRNIAVAAAKTSPTIVMEAVEIGEHSAVVSARSVGRQARDARLCQYTAGMLSQVSALFGMDAAIIVEPTCAARGDDRCRYEVSWDAASDPEADPVRRVHYLQQQLETVTSRFEALQATATDLTRAEDVSQALATITRRAGLAVRSPRYLLAVRLPGDPELRVHAAGFESEEDIEAATGELLAAGPDDHGGSRLVVDVASAHHHYGRLAALHHDGVRFFEAERKLLSSYAGHAAAALESAAALEEARRRGATTAALLELSQALAEVGTSSEVAQRLAQAVPQVVECERAMVLLWDPVHQHLVFGAQSGFTTGATLPDGVAGAVADQARRPTGRFTVAAEDSPAVAKLLRRPEPSFLGESSVDPLVDRMRAGGGPSRTAVVPIAARGEVFGVVSASLCNDSPDRLADADLLERLGAMAGQAATALENARLLEQVRHEALHDPLTGLPNRSLLKDRVDQTLREARRHATSAALLFVDLDHFKDVNDTFGHAVGDELICAVADRLGSCLRDIDTVARMGGDEFAVVLADVDDQSAVAVAGKLLAAVAEPLTIEGHDLIVSASIGVAIASGGDDYELLVKEADAAMYEAKAAGRGRCAVADRDATIAAHGRLALERELATAVDSDELHVLYQPLIDLASNRVVGAEALVRWNHPERGCLGPDAFIPVAERSDLIVTVDRWVLETACRQVAAWRHEGLAEVRMAVNLSGRTLLDPGLAEAVRAIFERTGIAPGLIDLEITDRVHPDDRSRFEATMAELTALGVRLTLDAFGTGRSAVRPLSRSSIDSVKIDRSFVSGMDAAALREPIVTATLALARSLGLMVAASGVETAEQADFLLAEGCETAQGFLFSRPVEAEALGRLLAEPAVAGDGRLPPGTPGDG